MKTITSSYRCPASLTEIIKKAVDKINRGQVKRITPNQFKIEAIEKSCREILTDKEVREILDRYA